MRKNIVQEIEIPDGVEVKIVGREVIVKGKEGENKREFKIGKIKIEKRENNIIVEYKNSTKNEKKIINSVAAHIRNMIRGVQKKFEYHLKVCFSHFPFNVKVEGRNVIIKNFLGEKVERRTTLPHGVEMKIEKENITLLSTDREEIGIAAANLERATQIKMRDRRVFQDGIFITSKDEGGD